jgi:hypothetical protein
MGETHEGPGPKSKAVNDLYLALFTPIGYLGVTVLPFWLGPAVGNGTLPAEMIGLIATAELLAMALANMTTSAIVAGRSIRRLVQIGMVVAMAGSLASIVQHTATLIGARIISGAALGTVNAAVAAAAARQPHPQRTLAMVQFGLLPVLAATTLGAPMLIGLWGLPGLFGTLALAALLGAATAGGFPDKGALQSGPNHDQRLPLSLPAIAACAAVAGYSAAQYCILPFIVMIGAHIDIPVGSVSIVVSLAILVTLAAPLCAWLLGERMGFTIPILSGLAIMAAGVWAVSSSGGLPLFAVGALIVYFAPSFILPYAFGLLARFDAAGRYASTFPGCLMLGAAMGPALAGPLAVRNQVQLMGFTAMGLLLLSAGLFATALTSMRRTEARTAT